MTKTIEEILEELKATGKCTIKGFGKFTIKVQKGREGISSFNGKPWKTEDKNVIKFTPSASLDVSDYTVNK